ncbi:hypothetical protein HD806DRAFT_5390 [Xylariaceae sp. AK1471]|nr:hypothetical protein HD806DRAFT_5390 [Xylariaceae sp. AK1471]
MENFTSKESYDASLIIRQFLLATPHHNQKPDERSLTARLCGESLELFREILKASTSGHCSTASSNLVSLERSFGRLKLWSDGYGIAAGRLDDVFARSQVIRNATQNLLSSLATTLTDRLVLRLINSTESTNEPLNTLILEVRSLVENIGDDDEEASSSDESSDFESDSIEEIVQDLLTDTLCLVELDPLLKSPIFDARDDKERVAAHNDTINWVPHQIYCERVESRFPQAINPLIFRLGKANYERYIRCQEERESHTDVRADDAESALLLLARANTVDGSNFHDSALGSSLPSTSSYAETIMSYGGNEGRSVRVPPLPLQGKAGKPFSCIACGRSVLISNNSAWKRHLYTDLCPWLCLDTSCSYGDKVYKSKSDWVSHLALGHHLEPKWGSMECPLCLKDTGAGKTAIVKHLSSHLEEISLGALPSGLEFDSESEDESQDTEDTHSDSSSKRKRSLHLDMANVPTNSDTLAPSEDEVPDEEPYAVKCLCDSNDGDDNTIYCESCDTWQHIRCYYPANPSRALTDDFVHLCDDCRSFQSFYQGDIDRGNELGERHPNVNAFEAPTATSNTTEVTTEKLGTKRIAQKVTSITETDAEQSKRDVGA